MRALMEAGITPDLIVGTSVGALNGATFAVNPTLEGLDKLADAWIRLQSSDLFPGTRMARAWKMLRRGESLYPNTGIRTLAEHIGVDDFEHLQIPTRVVASNLRTGKEQVFSSGSLTESILASTAMPGVFSPVMLDGETYVDGGVVNNVPISVAVAAGAKTIYVLNCLPCTRDDARQFRRPIDVLVQAVTHARASRLHHDLERYGDEVQFIIPPVPETSVRFDDNSQAARLIQLGYDNARSYLAHPANARRRVREGQVAELATKRSEA